MKARFELIVEIKNSLVGHPMTFLTLLKDFCRKVEHESKGVYKIKVKSNLNK